MKESKITPQSVWNEYSKGKTYNNNIGANGLYEQVKLNERFYVGDQWEGLNAPDLEKPVINFFKRIVSYYNSQLISDDISFKIEPYSSAPTNKTNRKQSDSSVYENVFPQEISRIIERNKLKAKHRDVLRNAAVDGDGVLYFRFDPNIHSGQDVKGEIVASVIDNTNILFGNPYSSEVQTQPYIIIVKREYTDTLKNYAKEHGAKDDVIESIKSDAESDFVNDDKASNLSTVLLRLWRDPETKTIHFGEYTKNAVIRDDTDTGLTLYPVAYMPWEKVKNCYHGRSPMTGLVPNQIAINQLVALSIINEKNTAFPKILYDISKIDKWTNKVGEAIGVNGNPNDAIASSFRSQDMSYQVTALIEQLLALTKDTMGASDAALGNIKPDNTSAIIAVQQAAALPLELQRLGFYQFIEDYVRILIDMMATYYGKRYVSNKNKVGANINREIDFSAYKGEAVTVHVEVGKAAYWNELTQMQTLDNLYKNNILTDPITYIESVPSGYLPNKERIVESIKGQHAQQMSAMQGQSTQGGQALTSPESAPAQLTDAMKAPIFNNRR